MPTMDIWYSRLSEHDVLKAVGTAASAVERTNKKAAKEAHKRTRAVAEARPVRRDSLQALSKLATRVDGQYRIVSAAAGRRPVAGAGREPWHLR